MGELFSLVRPNAPGDPGMIVFGQGVADGLNAASSLATPSVLMGRDANGRTQVAFPVATDDATPKGYVDQQIAAAAGQAVGVNAQTGTSYTPVIADRGRIITMNNASAMTLTLPQDSALAFPIGAEFTVINLGAGTLTISAGTGATVAGSTSSAANVGKRVIKRAANTWFVI